MNINSRYWKNSKWVRWKMERLVCTYRPYSGVVHLHNIRRLWSIGICPVALVWNGLYYIEPGHHHCYWNGSDRHSILFRKICQKKVENICFLMKMNHEMHQSVVAPLEVHTSILRSININGLFIMQCGQIWNADGPPLCGSNGRVLHLREAACLQPHWRCDSAQCILTYSSFLAYLFGQNSM